MTRVSRRALLAGGIVAMGAPATGLAAPPDRPPARATSSSGSGSERSWVIIELAGGADALSLVVPYRDDFYYRARTSTSISPPGCGKSAALRLTDAFALHPALSSLRAAFDEGELAVAIAAGPAAIDRSHFGASRTLRGTLFRALPNGNREEASVIDVERERPGALVARTREAARDAARGPSGLRIVRAAGWDTHTAQGSGNQGRLTALVGELGTAVDAFRREVGSERGPIALAIVSEFGRSLYETPMRGTDDGHAGVCLVVGRDLGARGVLGAWPGLDPKALSHGRYLAPTTDLETFLSEAEGRPAISLEQLFDHVDRPVGANLASTDGEQAVQKGVIRRSRLEPR
jgi:uncharacterized protein (DUF1501 family)